MSKYYLVSFRSNDMVYKGQVRVLTTWRGEICPVRCELRDGKISLISDLEELEGFDGLQKFPLEAVLPAAKLYPNSQIAALLPEELIRILLAANRETLSANAALIIAGTVIAV